VQPFDQVGNIQGHVDHEQIGAASGAQHLERFVQIAGMGDRGATVHGHFRRGGELPAKRSDDEQSHEASPALPDQRSDLMISVMVTPSLSSTSTTSPRPTKRSLTEMSVASPTLRSSSITVPAASLSRS